MIFLESKYYQSLFNHLDDGFVLHDKDNKIIDVNFSLIKKFSMNINDLKGKKIDFFFNESDLKTVCHHFQQVQKRGENISSIRLKNSKHPSEVYSKAIHFNGNEIILTHLKDNSLYLEIIEELKNSELEKMIILNTINEMVTYYDPEQKVLWANRAVLEYKNLSILDINGLRCSEVWHPHLNRCLNCATAQCLKNKDHCEILIDLDEKIFLTHCYPVFDDNKQIQALIEMRRDVTEQKKYEEKLKKSQEQYEKLFTHMADGFVLYQVVNNELNNPVNYKILKVNHVFEKMTGLKAKNIVNQFITEVIPNTDKALIKNFAEVGIFGKPMRFSNYSPEIDKYFEIIAYSPQKNYIATIVADITNRIEEKKNLIKSIELAEQAKKAAQSANEIKNQFLRNISHELRTPLNGILGMISLINLDHVNFDGQLYLDNIKTAAKNLLNLVNDILDFSKISEGKMKLDQTTFNLKELVDDLIIILKYKAELKNIELIIHTDNEVPENLYGDPIKLKQILINLIDNAIKFTERGFVKLSIEYIDHKNNHSIIKFRVIDTGIGIKKNSINTIFERFNQLDGGYTRKAGGVGLGLTIVKNLVEMMNGNIHVNSTPGKGTVFTLEIPFQIAIGHQPIKPQKIEPQKKATLKNLKIIIAEDEPTNQLYIEELFKTLGMNPTMAQNGNIVLEELEQHDFDLIIMDLSMPELDGIAATKKIRSMKDKKYASIPIIAMTAHVFQEDIDQCLQAGMNDFISKPVDPQKMINILHQFLNNKTN